MIGQKGWKQIGNGELGRKEAVRVLANMLTRVTMQAAREKSSQERRV